MKKMFFLLFTMMLLQAAGVSQACVDLPANMPIVASNTYLPTVPAISLDTFSNAFTDANSGMEFVHVIGGCYCMGAVDEKAPKDATPVHQACVDDYYMGKYEVTQAQWQVIMGSNPSTLRDCGDNCPVVDVSWNDVQEFIRRLSSLTGKAYRLPTEAEWEYAVRGSESQGTAVTASASSSDKKTTLRPVGWSGPNGFGIYDMQGSVWEWTADRYSKTYYRDSPQNNPEGPSEGSYRVLRGGSWDDTARSIQPTLRIKYEPWVKRTWVGFRLLSPDQTSAKFSMPEALALKENAKNGQQCRTAQQALSR